MKQGNCSQQKIKKKLLNVPQQPLRRAIRSEHGINTEVVHLYCLPLL